MAAKSTNKKVTNKKSSSKERAISVKLALTKNGKNKKTAAKTNKAEVKVGGKKTPVKAQSKKSTTIPVLKSFQSRLEKISKPNFSVIKKTKVNMNKKVWYSAGGVLVALIIIYLAATKLTVAWVDNRPISWFDYYSQLNSKYGSDLKDQMISQQLVTDEASNRHISVSDAEVNNEINNIKAQSGGDANFSQLLSQQGLTMPELQQQVKLQLLIQKMFSSGASVSAQEVKAYIQSNKDQYPTDDASTEAQVKQQLEQQKLVSVFQDWLTTAQNSNRVVKTNY